MTTRKPVGRSPLASVGIYLGATLLTLFSVFPLYWMFMTSVKPRAEILTSTPDFWPSVWEWGRYLDVIERGFGRALGNSLLVSVVVTVLGVGVSAFAGYAFARMNVPLKKYLLLVVLATQMFPVVVMIIPLFIIMRNLGLLDQLLGLIISYMSFTTPLAIWILRGFFRGIPDDVEEAALVDGATRFQAITRVVMPIAAPGLSAAAIFVFIAAWNEFLFALTFVKAEPMQTLPVALQSFIGRGATDHGAIMAFSVLFTLPVVIFFLLVHRRITQGTLAGALKG
ncbi:MAG: ABC transporter permease subunit [Acidimicrobiia bacterium]|nr:ABC transporter permease subunit [Acidimicrobiia bacterium]